MREEIVILCTCASEAEAEKIALHLLEQRLAACVNVMPAGRSYYRWHGAIESAVEHLLFIKSSSALFPEVEKAVRQLHSYKVPELLALSVTAGSADYLRWLHDNLSNNV